MDMKPFVSPRSADNPKPWRKADVDRYKILANRHNKIVIELSKLEGGLP
jgi:hypothetical protein